MPGAGTHLSHFWAMFIFALLVSVALASLGRQSLKGRIKSTLWSLALFLAVAVGIGWLMYPLSR